MAKAKKRKADMHRLLSQRASYQRGKVTVAASPWDHGATGPANRVGLVVEERGEVDPATGKITNPNRVTGVRRVDLLEVWSRKGKISVRGYDAAVKLRARFEATQKAPGWPDNDRVQSSPKPDHAIAIYVDRISAFHRLNRLVPEMDREIIDACVLRGATPYAAGYRGKRYQMGMEHLAAAVERLADAMG